MISNDMKQSRSNKWPKFHPPWTHNQDPQSSEYTLCFGHFGRRSDLTSFPWRPSRKKDRGACFAKL